MIAGNVGDVIEGLHISLPEGLDIDEVMSVSSDPHKAYIEIDRESGDGRAYSAKIVMLSPGIVEMKISSVDGEFISDSLTVNVVGSDSTEETEAVDPVPEENEVYVTPTGERYHLRQSCAGATAYGISLKEAVEKGYTPCKSCATYKK